MGEQVAAGSWAYSSVFYSAPLISVRSVVRVQAHLSFQMNTGVAKQKAGKGGLGNLAGEELNLI